MADVLNGKKAVLVQNKEELKKLKSLTENVVN